MTLAVRRVAFAVSALLCGSSVVQAQPVHVNPDGIGQVLIYPYYTVRNGWTTLLSIVNNDSANGKAVKLRFLEGKNGALVASLNIFLAAEDVWTGAVVAGSAADLPPKLVSNDFSCSWPNLRTTTAITETGSVVTTRSLAFSNQAYVADGDSVAMQTIDRTRDGYFEVIEMASIPFDREALSPLARQIWSNAYSPSQCNLLGDTDLLRYFSADISVPNGGLSGATSLVNVLGGASAEYTPVALNGFWASSNGVSPQLTVSTSPLPDLTSGGNVTAIVDQGGKAYFSKFQRSIDAVSAVLMTEQLMGEHAFTVDGTIATTWAIAMPTKRFYTQGIATEPYSKPWDGTTGTACDDMTLTSFDRESVLADESCGFVCPPSRRRALCFGANALSFGGVNSAGGDLTFGSTSTYGYVGNQNGGGAVVVPGKEGGKTRLRPSSPLARLIAASGSIASVDAVTGVVSVATGPHTFYGLPMIGVAFNQSSFRTGNPQQNYASGFRLQSTRRVTSP